MSAVLAKLSKPASVKLVVVRGDSLYLELRLRDKDRGSPIPLTGLTGTATIRTAIDAPGSTTLTVNVSQDAAGQPNTGVVTITATGDETLMYPEVGVWDLQLSDGSPNGVLRKTIVKGDFTLTRDVTR